MSIRDYVDTTCGNTTPPGEIPFEQWVRDQFQNMNNKIGELETRINQMGTGIGMVLSGGVVGIPSVRAANSFGSRTEDFAGVVGAGVPGQSWDGDNSIYTNISVEDFNVMFPPVLTNATNSSARHDSGAFSVNNGIIISIPTSGTITRVSIFSSVASQYINIYGISPVIGFSCCPWGIIRYTGNGHYTRAEYTRWCLSGPENSAGYSGVSNTSIWVTAGDIVIVYMSAPGALGWAGSQQHDEYNLNEPVTYHRGVIPVANAQVILSPGA